jgi:predicted DNA-binding transcriptional regulator AlpA
MITITEPIILIDDLEKIIGVNKFTLYKRIRNNQFPKGVKFNGKKFFRQSDLQKYYDDLGIKVNIELPSN